MNRVVEVCCKLALGAGSSEDQKGSRIIGKLLPAAVRLYLRSQVEEIGELSIDLAGRDRQIISGYIPGVSIFADRVVYRGLHVDQVALSAEDIRINIGQVLRGKPLRLLKGFPVLGRVVLTGDGLTASLGSGLLREGVCDFWRALCQHPGLSQEIDARYGQLALHEDVTFSQLAIRLGEGCLGLSFHPATQDEVAACPIVLGTAVAIDAGHFLKLGQARWLDALSELENFAHGVPIKSLEGFCWDLGADTQLSELVLTRSQLLCEGQISVVP